jgi:flagellar hook-associated protein 1 FlgK
MGVLNIGITGLRVAQAGLLTTSHNISNSSTIGYNRQENFQTTAMPNFAGYGFVGQGSNVASVRRVYSEYLTTQILGAQANVGELDMYLMQAKQIDNLLADSNAGLSPALSEFFQATQQVAADPASIPARQSMLSSGQALAARFEALDQRLTEIRNGVNTQLTNEVSAINAYANQIAELNDRIVQATSIAQGQPPNDLLDQRDNLIAAINKEIKVTVVPDAAGVYNVFIGTGQPLVVGTAAYKFTTDTVSHEDAERVSVSMQAPNGIKIDIPENLLQGGQLGGLLKFRSETLDVAQNSLGKVALSVAMTFNNQHRQGIDLQGQFGGNFFTETQPAVLANAKNTGDATLTAQIYESDYLLDVTAGSIYRLSDNPPTEIAFTGFPMVVDGVTLKEPADPITEGKFIIKPGNPAGQRVFPASDNPDPSLTFESSGSNLQSLPTIASDYRLLVTDAGLRLERLADKRTWFAADMTEMQEKLAADPQGFVLDWQDGVEGESGDSFLIQPTRNAAKTFGVVISDPMKFAAAAPFRTSSALTNEGSGKIDTGTTLVALDREANVLADDPPLIPLANKLILTYDEENSVLVLTDDADPPNDLGEIAFVPGQSNVINYRGMRFTISGEPADQDVFTIEANRNGVSDNRNAIALGGLQMKAVLNNGSATYQSTYGQIVSFVGNKTREVEVTGLAQQTLVDQAENSRQQLSGVNLDEEAANLLKFQQAYQSAAKVMQIASTLFDELLAVARA